MNSQLFLSSLVVFSAVLYCCYASSTNVEFYKSQCLELCCLAPVKNVICDYVCIDCEVLINQSASVTPTAQANLTEVLAGKTMTTTVTPLAVIPAPSAVPASTTIAPTTGSYTNVLPPPTIPTPPSNRSTLQDIYASAYKANKTDATVNTTDASLAEQTVTNATGTPPVETTGAQPSVPALYTASSEDLGLKLCCSFAGVPDSCNICSWSANKTTIVNAGLVCLPYLKPFTECAAEGHNNADCCTNQSVPLGCLSFCTAEIPQFDPVLLPCLDYIPQIFSCHKASYTGWKADNATGHPASAQPK